MAAYANMLRNLATGNLKVLQLPDHPKHGHQPSIARQWLAIGFASAQLLCGHDITQEQYNRWRSLCQLEG